MRLQNESSTVSSGPCTSTLVTIHLCHIGNAMKFYSLSAPTVWECGRPWLKSYYKEAVRFYLNALSFRPMPNTLELTCTLFS
jgi:hypothetical protein